MEYLANDMEYLAFAEPRRADLSCQPVSGSRDAESFVCMATKYSYCHS